MGASESNAAAAADRAAFGAAVWRVKVIFFIILAIAIAAAIVAVRLRVGAVPLRRGGAEHPVLDVRPGDRSLIIDVANMYVGWYYEKHGRVPGANNQSVMFAGYIECMKEHYDNMPGAAAPAPRDRVIYVMKNMKSARKKSGRAPEQIGAATFAAFEEFVAARPGAIVAIAADYAALASEIWDNTKYHYVRGYDDHMCFHIAQLHKRGYAAAVIMSNDKFKDFAQFDMIHPYIATIISATAPPASVRVDPAKHRLGQIQDYTRAPITIDFDFREFDAYAARKTINGVLQLDVPPDGKIWQRIWGRRGGGI